ncbi:hypothetical protein [Methylobacterium longum]|uniref:DUF222 domain-containing protein n=1 Tax=Methylobacterium longum TaxID=767694 RepID=A0ABT8AKP5_9HYPH|nr:hypothetical protein [Methylobacterium longum]MDN3569863.1 hypothetical protein [Methylobacterium longum]GJE13273.1 hypothetical protein FOHLNKBM_4336 [Methylobacterium longum]
MSGPKVVRVVTREELEATCRRWLLLVGEAAADLLRNANRFGLASSTLQSQVAARRAALEALLHSERWSDLQKDAAGAIEHFRFEGERLRGEAVAAEAAQRSRQRRTLDAARSVAASLAKAGHPVPAALTAAIDGAMTATGADLDTMQRAVEASLATLVQGKPQKQSSEQSDLAARLDAGGPIPAFAQWIEENARPDPQAERLDGLLSELSTRSTLVDISDLTARAISITTEPSADRRALLTDSLILEAARRLQDERAIEVATGRAMGVRAELAAFPSDVARACSIQLDTAISNRNTAEMRTRIAEGERLLDEGRRQASAVARRRAVLGGLASLGYEIREGMEAAWAKEGRIVVRRPGTDDYGVEFAAPADASRLQARLVGSDRPSSPRNAMRDKDQETIWCGQFDKLREVLVSGGSRVEMERALAAGDQAVKSVSMRDNSENDQANVVRPQARVLPIARR